MIRLPPTFTTLELAKAEAAGDPPRRFNSVGANQSEVLFVHDPSFIHERGRGSKNTAIGAAILRNPRPYNNDNDREKQAKRHLATVVDTYLRGSTPNKRAAHQEVQVAHAPGNPNLLIISTNTRKGNQKLRDELPQLIEYINGEPTPGSSARQIRHHNKFKTRNIGKEIVIISREAEGEVKGKHAERRLFEAQFLKPAGTMRPCGTCWTAIENPMPSSSQETGPGPIWTSDAANPRNSDGKKLVSLAPTRVTVGHDGRRHYDYDTESDSEYENTDRMVSNRSEDDEIRALEEFISDFAIDELENDFAVNPYPSQHPLPSA